jgi:hypothetical protein
METKAIDRIDAGLFFSALRCQECNQKFIVIKGVIMNISQAFNEYANNLYGFQHIDCETYTQESTS